MNSIAIWADRPLGNDPTTHFWFEHDRTRYRLCDGHSWIDGSEPDNQLEISVSCNLCIETYVVDVVGGRRLLTPYINGHIPVDNGHTPIDNGHTPVDNGWQREPKGAIMPERRISVFDFARFCDARPERQESIVARIRKRDGYDYYGPLKHLIRKTHWANNDIGILEKALPSFLDRQKDSAMSRNFKIMTDAYIRYWTDRASDYFPVKLESPGINLGGLTVWVNPEMGMRTKDDDYQMLKLWFNRLQPTRQTRLVIGHLVASMNPHPQQWHSGIWDIRRGNVPLPVIPPSGFDTVLIGQAAALVQLWDSLDEAAKRQME